MTRKAPRDAPTTVGQLDADGSSTTMNGVKMNDTTINGYDVPSRGRRHGERRRKRDYLEVYCENVILGSFDVLMSSRGLASRGKITYII